MPTGTIRQFFNEMGIDFDSMELNQPVTVGGDWEIQTLDSKTEKPVWKKVTRIVRKQPAQHMTITTESGLDLHCSPEHKVFTRSKQTAAESYQEAAALAASYDTFEVRTVHGWETFKVAATGGSIEIADLEVEGEHSYLSNGILSHNTAYGDPTTTSGGMAIPYHASVRIRLMGGSQIKKTIDGKEVVIGINVTAKTIKNKVARPWREVAFEIHFGRGIQENDQLFDELREFCDNAAEPVIVNNKKVKLEGTSQWKQFTVSDNETGEVEHSIKFFKSDFTNKVLSIPELQPYVTALMDSAFVVNPLSDKHKTFASIDTSSAVEVEAATVSAKKQGAVAGRSVLLD